MSKHRTEKGWWYWYIRRMKVQRHYLLNQWYCFKKPKLKRQWKELTTTIRQLLTK